MNIGIWFKHASAYIYICTIKSRWYSFWSSTSSCWPSSVVDEIISKTSSLSWIEAATAEGLLFQGVDLWVFKGGDVLGLTVIKSSTMCLVGADRETTGDGGQTSFNRFRISSGVISKSGLLFVYGRMAFFCTCVSNTTCSHNSYSSMRERRSLV